MIYLFEKYVGEEEARDKRKGGDGEDSFKAR